MDIDEAAEVEAYVASWIEMFMIGIMILMTLVEAYVASWIEIHVTIKSVTTSGCRRLRSLVD